MLYNIIVILIIIVCVLLALVVLVQNSKGGGLAANFSAPTQVLGARQSADFIEKATWGLALAMVVITWWLAGLLVGLSLIATISIHRGQTTDPLKSEVKVADYAPVQQAPAAPAAMPVTASEAEADQQ